MTPVTAAHPDITHLLWADLETTGTDPVLDEIVEVGSILTTLDLDVLEEYQDIVVPSPAGQRRVNENGIVSRMHADSGLLDVLDAAIGHAGQQTEAGHQRMLSRVEGSLVEILDAHGASRGKVALAGSGVGHLDRAFIARHMPRLSSRLAYWTLDIGPIRRATALWMPRQVPSVNDSKTHRAMDDVRAHLADARAIRATFMEVS